MGRHYYRIGQFARMVSVSVRTLRFYDKVGLFSPAEHTESGYRLYTDDDLARVQQILALKFLGFSLDEIKVCLCSGPRRFQDVLSTQKAMMREKRDQVDTIIRALEETERVVRDGCDTWDAVVHVIEVMQMQPKDDWHSKYFTPEQRQQMEELSKASYSEEARRKLAHSGAAWTEEDQRRADEQWGWIGSELKRLVAAGADPGSPEAQAVVRRQRELLAQFTQGDPEISAGLRQWWENFYKLPQEQRPVQPPFGKEEGAFLAEASKIADERSEQIGGA